MERLPLPLSERVCKPSQTLKPPLPASSPTSAEPLPLQHEPQVPTQGSSPHRQLPEGLGRGGGGLVCAFLRFGWRLARGHPFRIQSGHGERIPASRDRSILCRDYLTPMISTFNPELVCASLARSLMSGPRRPRGSPPAVSIRAGSQRPLLPFLPLVYMLIVSGKSSLIGRMRQSKRIVSQAEPN